jgi:hypothetical protein
MNHLAEKNYVVVGEQVASSAAFGMPINCLVVLFCRPTRYLRRELRVVAARDRNKDSGTCKILRTCYRKREYLSSAQMRKLGLHGKNEAKR